MSYLTRGKRSIIEHEYGVEVLAWSRHFKVPAPRVQVRIRRAGNYRAGRISVPPNAERKTLVHEFAHHLDHVVYDRRGHGLTFRIALVQVATVAYGRADSYPWASEYMGIAAWARRHGLIRDEPAPSAALLFRRGTKRP